MSYLENIKRETIYLYKNDILNYSFDGNEEEFFTNKKFLYLENYYRKYKKKYIIALVREISGDIHVFSGQEYCLYHIEMCEIYDGPYTNYHLTNIKTFKKMNERVEFYIRNDSEDIHRFDYIMSDEKIFLDDDKFYKKYFIANSLDENIEWFLDSEHFKKFINIDNQPTIPNNEHRSSYNNIFYFLIFFLLFIILAIHLYAKLNYFDIPIIFYFILFISIGIIVSCLHN